MTAREKLMTHKINEVARLNSKKRSLNKRIQMNVDDIRDLQSLDTTISISELGLVTPNKRLTVVER